MAAWIKPKMASKHMVQKLLQVRAHLILCFRAEEKIEMVRGDDGKMKIIPKVTPTGLSGWVPICEKNLPYELTASFLLTADAPGVPKPIKLQEQHRALFPLDKPITEESGRLIAAWAAGGKPVASPQPGPSPERTAVDSDRPADRITDDQALTLEALCTENGIAVARLKKAAGVDLLADILAADLARARQWVDAAIAKTREAA